VLLALRALVIVAWVPLQILAADFSFTLDRCDFLPACETKGGSKARPPFDGIGSFGWSLEHKEYPFVGWEAGGRSESVAHMIEKGWREGE
jgi:hypothetical protein